MHTLQLGGEDDGNWGHSKCVKRFKAGAPSAWWATGSYSRTIHFYCKQRAQFITMPSLCHTPICYRSSTLTQRQVQEVALETYPTQTRQKLQVQMQWPTLTENDSTLVTAEQEVVLQNTRGAQPVTLQTLVHRKRHLAPSVDHLKSALWHPLMQPLNRKVYSRTAPVSSRYFLQCRCTDCPQNQVNVSTHDFGCTA